MNGELIVVDDLPAEFAERITEAFHRRPDEMFGHCAQSSLTAV